MLFNKLILLLINIFYVVRHSKVSNEMHMSIEMQKTTEVNSVILEDTPSQNPFGTQNQLTVVKGTPDETKSKTGENILIQNTKCIPVKKNRRKLLPLTQISQYSISPIEERKCIPEESTSTKRNKRMKTKPPKRKSIYSKNTNNIMHDTSSKQMQSDSDCDILENKKKEEKTRKPKKVISKKIFIKKFADENVLNILQRNRQNKGDNSLGSRDSLDDFVKCRTTSTQWNRYKSQKIIIVTTGLSKE